MLSRLFRRRPDADRLIFKYHDGTRDRYADPVAAWQELERACGGDPGDLLKSLAPQPPTADPNLQARIRADQAAAGERLAEAAGYAFGVGPLTDSGGRVRGLTVPERIGLVRDLCLYLRGLANAAGPFTTSPSPTGASPPA